MYRYFKPFFNDKLYLEKINWINLQIQMRAGNNMFVIMRYKIIIALFMPLVFFIFYSLYLFLLVKHLWNKSIWSFVMLQKMIFAHLYNVLSISTICLLHFLSFILTSACYTFYFILLLVIHSKVKGTINYLSPLRTKLPKW